MKRAIASEAVEYYHVQHPPFCQNVNKAGGDIKLTIEVAMTPRQISAEEGVSFVIGWTFLVTFLFVYWFYDTYVPFSREGARFNDVIEYPS